MKSANLLCILIALSLLFGWTAGIWAAKDDCGDPPNVPAKPAKEVKKEDVNVQNDYDEVIEEDTKRRGVTYLTFINGDQPKPNKCGLNPSNDLVAWTGWGGPINADNMTIGEGAGSRNDIVIGGVLFERGLGTHSPATIEYSLTGESWVAFEGYVGMADEKDPAECVHGGNSEFTFLVDGKEMFKSEVLTGTQDGENVEAVKVEFDIPAGGKELTILISDGGDGNCGDHSAIGDAKLLTRQAFSVNSKGKLTTSWGAIKALY